MLKDILKSWEFPADYIVGESQATKELLTDNNMSEESFLFWLLFFWLPEQDAGKDALKHGNVFGSLVPLAVGWRDTSVEKAPAMYRSMRRSLASEHDKFKALLDSSTGYPSLLRLDEALKELNSEMPGCERYLQVKDKHFKDAKIMAQGCPWALEQCIYAQEFLEQ